MNKEEKESVLGVLNKAIVELAHAGELLSTHGKYGHAADVFRLADSVRNTIIGIKRGES